MFLFCGGSVTPQLCISFKRSFIDALFAESVLRKKPPYVKSNLITYQSMLHHFHGTRDIRAVTKCYRSKPDFEQKKKQKNPFVLWQGQEGTYYRKTSNISRTLVGDKIVDNSDVVGASPVGAAPTTSSFSTEHLASMD